MDPVRVRFRQSGVDLADQLGPLDVGKDMEVGREDGNSSLSTGTPESGSGPRPEMIPVPDSPSLSVQLPTPQGPAVIPQPLEFSFDRTCAPSQVPREDGAQNAELTWGHLRDQCSQRGYWQEESKAVSKTRLPTMDAAEAMLNLAEVRQEGGKRERNPPRGSEGVG